MQSLNGKELLEIENGLVADTPGFSALHFDGMSASDIRDNFIEFNEYMGYDFYRTYMLKDRIFSYYSQDTLIFFIIKVF